MYLLHINDIIYSACASKRIYFPTDFTKESERCLCV